MRGPRSSRAPTSLSAVHPNAVMIFRWWSRREPDPSHHRPGALYATCRLQPRPPRARQPDERDLIRACRRPITVLSARPGARAPLSSEGEETAITSLAGAAAPRTRSTALWADKSQTHFAFQDLPALVPPPPPGRRRNSGCGQSYSRAARNMPPGKNARRIQACVFRGNLL